MKKMTFVIAAFMFMVAAPVIAGTATITVVDVGAGSGWAEIRYSADANISAFALDVTVSAGTITQIGNYFIGECNDTLKGYGIFLGTIDILDTGEVNDWGTPIGQVADLPGDTKPGLGNNGVTVEMGALYTTGKRPSRTGTLCRLKCSSSCNMTVAGNVGRGKVVQENGTQATLVLTGATNIPIVVQTQVQVPNIVGLVESAAETALTNVGLTVGTQTYEWHNSVDCEVLGQNPASGTFVPPGSAVSMNIARNWTFPACWNYVTQCNGDTNNDVAVDTVDWPKFRDGFGKTYPNATYQANACGDFNRDGTIDTVDWPRFRDNFGKVPASNCVQGDTLQVYKPGTPANGTGCQ
jgi:hypothetical protein